MAVFKKLIFIATLFHLGQTVFCLSEVYASKSQIHVPSDISEEAKNTLKLFISIIDKSGGKKLFRDIPEADDYEGWKKMKLEDEASEFYKSHNEKVIKKYNPHLTNTKIGGVPTLVVTPKEWQDQNKILIYIHGGAFTSNSAELLKFCVVPMAHKSGLKAISIEYDKAPFAKHEHILGQIVSVFKGLLESGYQMEDIAVYGDSSGGNLAASAVLKMRDEGLGMPAAVILWSPWLDLTGSGDTYTTLEAQDPLLSNDALKKCALAYSDKENHRSPYVSPLFGDFSKGFPPTLLQFGTKEMLASDSIRFFQTLKKANQTVEMDPYDGMWHVFQAWRPELPESKMAHDESVKFLRKHLLKRKEN